MRKQDRKAQLRQLSTSPATPAETALVPATLNDSLNNFITRVGQQANVQAAGSTFAISNISNNRQLLGNAYRGSWVCAKAVDTIAESMVKAGIDITSEIEPSKIEELQAYLKKLHVWDGICDSLKWSRLYGAGFGIILISGQRLETELKIDRISQDQFKGVIALDRWLLQPSSEIITIADLDSGASAADLGRPKFYDVVADTTGVPRGRIHWSRVIRLEGQTLPYYDRQTLQGHGASVLEKLWDVLLNYIAATQGTGQLVEKAHLRTIRVDGLRDNIIAVGGEAEEAFFKNMRLIQLFQSNSGLTVLDKNDEFAVNTYNFSGLDNVLTQLGQQVSGALGIPIVILYGQSPAGFSTGESDLENFYGEINMLQESKLRSPVEYILQIAYRSKFGAPPPASFSFTFNPLWSMSEAEKATVAKSTTDSVVAAKNAGIISKATALRELKQSSHVTGVYSNISDEEISAAEEFDKLEAEAALNPPNNPNAEESDPAVSEE